MHAHPAKPPSQLTIWIGHPALIDPLHERLKDARPVFRRERRPVQRHAQRVANLLGVAGLLFRLHAEGRRAGFAAAILSTGAAVSTILVGSIPVAHVQTDQVGGRVRLTKQMGRHRRVDPTRHGDYEPLRFV